MKVYLLSNYELLLFTNAFALQATDNFKNKSIYLSITYESL